jgi:predicted dehydrogenase/threonine dehydrogenase-like Zn-dependent dehydrogenase
MLISVFMKQLLQNISTGKATVMDVPAPQAGPGEILVRVGASLISAGTEKMVVEFAEKNVLQKAMARPDLVRQALNKASREGILSTFSSLRQRLDTDMALGYSNAGEVIEVGDGVSEFKIGERVACAGGGFAVHAEFVRIPKNLAAKVPEPSSSRPAIEFEEAAFTTVGAIGLQGLRLANLQLGETVAVIGLGLIGLLVVQLVRASGCNVVGMDVDEQRCRLARELGCGLAASDAEQMRSMVAATTGGKGADSVLITASTKSNEPVTLAGDIARDCGRVVAVGAVGLEIPRKTYYEKELSFYVSRSYGPGRYDPEYEQFGRDYPIGYVRWTENRNMQAFLQLLADSRVDVKKLITHRFDISQADKAYELITGKTGERFTAVTIHYPVDASAGRLIAVRTTSDVGTSAAGRVTIGMLGAGNFATAVLLPVLKNTANVQLVGLATASGASARAAGSRYGFSYCTSDYEEVLRDSRINTVVIATRHNLHAQQVIGALDGGKHVFCEKPLCISDEELQQISQAYYRSRLTDAKPLLMVGYNRRFAPMAVRMRDFLRTASEPLMMNYRVNAGFLPAAHWTQTAEEGAGRIIGEVCHFIDFLVWLSGARATSVYASALPNNGKYCNDNLVATLEFEDGSVGTITYVANGDRSLPKERIEVFGGGCVAILDDFRVLSTTRAGRQQSFRSRLRQDKGHANEWKTYADAVSTGDRAPIAFKELVNVSQACFGLLDSVRLGRRYPIRPEEQQSLQAID